MNTPQSSETWRERLAHTYWGKIKPLTTNISPDHLEDFVAHEIAEAERRGYESGYEIGFVAGGNIGYKKGYAAKESELTN